MSIFEKINIQYNQKKLSKDALRKIKYGGDPAYSIERKWLLANIKIKKENETCILKGKIRLTGDLNDHIRMTNFNETFSSILIEMSDESINGMMRFKLLLPETRNGMNEVFAANLLSSMGFIAPRTSMIDTYINGIKRKVILQEDLTKEMLEYNGRVEGPIIEGDERFGIGKLLSLSRMVNYKWATKSKTHFDISIEALSQINYAYLTHSTLVTDIDNDPKFDLSSALSNTMPVKNRNEIDTFNALVYALSAQHLLSRDDSRFYFDIAKGFYYPIYYDGQPNFLELTKPQPLFNMITESAYRGIESALEKLNQLDVQRLDIKLKKNGFKFGKQNTGELIVKLRHAINTLKTLRVFDRKYSFSIQSLINNKEMDNKKFIIKSNASEWVKCNSNFFECSNITLNDKMLGAKEARDLIFIGNIFRNNDNMKLISPKHYPFRIQNNEPALVDDTFLYAARNTEIIIDRNKKLININSSDSNSHILFEGGKLFDWQIRFQGVNKKINLVNDRVTRFFPSGLTGCLNFRDVDLDNIKIFVKDSHCEDAINTVNVRGNIREINTDNSYADGLDLDFSELRIDKVKIINSGNDCIDV